MELCSSKDNLNLPKPHTQSKRHTMTHQHSPSMCCAHPVLHPAPVPSLPVPDIITVLESAVLATLDGHHMLQVGWVVVVILHALRHIIKLISQLPWLHLQRISIYTSTQWYEHSAMKRKKNPEDTCHRIVSKTNLSQK